MSFLLLLKDKDHMDLSRKIGADVTICGLAPNNTKQLKAIQGALSSRFSLIQGPPGMRFTRTKRCTVLLISGYKSNVIITYHVLSILRHGENLHRNKAGLSVCKDQ